MLEPFLKILLYSLPFSFGPLEMGTIPSSSVRESNGANAVARTTIRTWDGPQKTFFKQYEKGELLFSTETLLDETHQVLSTRYIVDVTGPTLHTEEYSYKDGKLNTWKAYLYGTATCFYIGDKLDSVYISGEEYGSDGMSTEPQPIKFTYDSNGNLIKKETHHPIDQLVFPDIWEYTYYLPDSVVAKMDKYWTKTYYLKNGLPFKEVDKDSSGMNVRLETTVWSYGSSSGIRMKASKPKADAVNSFQLKGQDYNANGVLKIRSRPNVK
ncbi:MAG: hypothetical protein JWO30_3466 [Fibrobacteres bacterium]|nr:hypothetical protein [Fibrobacterota bacterium]